MEIIGSFPASKSQSSALCFRLLSATNQVFLQGLILLFACRIIATQLEKMQLGGKGTLHRDS